ncbi:MAG: nitroreductase family protein [Anaerolineae bacterium]
MDLYEAIRRRRSVRRYADTPVEEAKLLRILEAARLAPSWRNGQCWRFVVVRERETIRRLAREQPLGYQINRWLERAPVVVVACADPRASGRRGDQDFYLVDVAIALEHLVLAATAEGLGTCWIGALDEESIRRTLGIPDSIRVVAMTPVGYPAEDPGWFDRAVKAVARSKRRRPLPEIVHWDRWGQQSPPSSWSGGLSPLDGAEGGI